mgnify:FL=1
MANNIKELREALEHHDWYYNYADDFRAYRAGQASMTRIHELIAKSDDVEEAVKLHNEVCPETHKISMDAEWLKVRSK